MDAERRKRIEDLYLAARELEPDKRKVFLAEACEGDALEGEELLCVDGLKDGDQVGFEIDDGVGVFEVLLRNWRAASGTVEGQADHAHQFLQRPPFSR